MNNVDKIQFGINRCQFCPDGLVCPNNTDQIQSSSVAKQDEWHLEGHLHCDCDRNLIDIQMNFSVFLISEVSVVLLVLISD